MAGSTKVIGKTITCMVMVYTPGRMVENTKVNMKRTKNMDLECIIGPMEEDTKGIGLMVNNMGKVNIMH